MIENKINQQLYNIYSGILCNNQKFYEGKKTEIQYIFDCEEFQLLKQKYHLEDIAKTGSDFEKALRLLHHFAPRLEHKGNYDNHIDCNALSLLEYCYNKKNVGINCLNKSKILEECCLAIGIYARRVSIRPYSPYDFDNHVVTEIFDRDVNKWIMLDCTNDGYCIDENKIPLSCLEMRNKISKQELCTVVYANQDNHDIKNLFYTNLDDNWYYAKNMFYFVIDEVSSFGETGDDIYLIPTHFDVKRNIINNLIYKINNAKEMHINQKIFIDKIENTQKTRFQISSIEGLWDSPVQKGELL